MYWFRWGLLEEVVELGCALPGAYTSIHHGILQRQFMCACIDFIKININLVCNNVESDEGT